PSGNFLYTVDANTGAGVGLDPASGNLYVVESDRVAQYDVSGSAPVRLGEFGRGAVTPAGVGVNGASGNVYVSDAAANDVAVFGPGVPTPDVTTGAASAVSDTAATLNGSVNPNGLALSDCHFEYSTDPGFAGAQSAACSPAAGSIPADSSDHAV